MDVVIYGHGSHGADVAEIAEAAGHTVVGWLDDFPGRNEPPPPHLFYEAAVYSGVNDPQQRFCTVYYFYPAPPLLHPSAIVSPDARLGHGTVIAQAVAVGNGVRTGSHVHIGAGSSLIRCTVGPYTTIAPGVNIAGDVHIGGRCFIGVGAVISNLVTVGHDAVIGAGAVVLEDVPAGDTVVGIPARSTCGKLS